MFFLPGTIGSRQSHLSSFTPDEPIYNCEKSIYRLYWQGSARLPALGEEVNGATQEPAAASVDP
jgi:hypothetical protein